jgi:hypothetical protein
MVRMNRLKKRFFNQPKKTKFIVKESYSGTKNLQNIFAYIFISEYGENSKKIWALEQKIDIIGNSPQQVVTDNSLISCCSRKE